MKMIKKCKCNGCDNILSKKNKSGYCTRHRPRTGENNPFFGKKHSNKTKKHLSNTSSESTKKLWQDDEYRKKVIKNATGLKRSDNFKKEQSLRIKKWYEENPNQRVIRSKHMKQSWEDGKIEPNINSINESKQEKELRTLLIEKLNNRKIQKKTIKIDGKYFYPDILIDNKIIVEFYGNFWHANPLKYKENDIIHHGEIAKEIWSKDKKRINILQKNGYNVFIIWQSDYEANKEKCIRNLIKKVNNEN